MTNLNTMTAAELANYFNQLQGTSIKPSSYSKANWIAKIAKIEAEALAEDSEAEAITDSDLDEEAETFTLAELARALKVSPKIARARYRAVENDGVRTFYEFPKNQKEIERVTSIILPKRTTKK